MMVFCTLFDSYYASKGIAMYLSLERLTNDFILYVMALDRQCQERLSRCGFRHMLVECIDDVMTPELSEAKSNRSLAEFCWTCGAYFTDYFLNKYNLPEITYLDSDLMFINSPSVVFEELEMKKASVGLVSHFAKYPMFGKYCVQFVYFKNDDAGRNCLRWWRDECLKWCYCKMENGKYADQKYLEYFANRFDNVYDIENRGVGIACWNMNRYRYTKDELYFEGKKYPQVFFHYSGIAVSVENGVMVFKHTMFLSKAIRKTFILPYAELMKESFNHYLDIPVIDVRIMPSNPKNYWIKPIMFYLNKIVPVDWTVAQVMKLKYRDRKTPYDEKL